MAKLILSLLLLVLSVTASALPTEGDPDHCPKNVSKKALGFGPLGVANPHLSDQLASIAARTANLDFTLSMLKQLSPGALNANQNLIVAPFSLATALTMARTGMTGESAKQTDKALAYAGLDFSEATSGMAAISDALQAQRDVVFRNSNGLWLGKGYRANDAFKLALQKNFSASVETTDFATDAGKNLINSTVSRETQGMIPALLDRTDAKDVLYLTNALYLDAQWEEVFDITETRNMDFVRPDGSTQPVKMMTRTGAHAIVMSSEFDAVRLPLAGSRIFVDAIIPKKQDIDDFVAGLQRDQLSEWNGLLGDAAKQRRTSSIRLPRLNLEFGGDMIPMLQALGMQKPFTAAAGPELAGLVQNVNDLFLSVVIHKVKLELNEKGVRAGAGSAVGGSRSLAPTLTFNRPFVVLIRDLDGAILFSGIVANPS